MVSGVPMASGAAHAAPIATGPSPIARTTTTSTGRRAGPNTLLITTDGTIVRKPRVAASATVVTAANGMNGARTRRNGITVWTLRPCPANTSKPSGDHRRATQNTPVHAGETRFE